LLAFSFSLIANDVFNANIMGYFLKNAIKKNESNKYTHSRGGFLVY